MFDLLKGIKIIDITTVVLGPYATQLLADFGAEVIKVEPLEGDVWRAARPGRSAGMGAGFINCNRNKKSIAVDLKKPEGREIVHELVKRADVFIHNTRPSSAGKLGLSYETLRGLNPKLLYCFSAGYGQDGPYRDEPAYDDIIQAMSGLAHLNSNAQGEPQFLKTIACDKIAGLHLALAVAAGLVKRGATGEGCSIEAPMFECMVSFLMLENLAGFTFEPPMGGIGYTRLTSPYRKPYRTADGFMSILPYNTAHWTEFFKLIGREDMARADWTRDPVQRSERIDDLYRVVEEASPTRTTQEWLRLLRERDIPCAPVKSLTELLNDDHLAEVGFYERYRHPSEGEVRGARAPFVVEGAEETADLPAQQLGENTREILTELGYDERRIGTLREQGIVLSA